MVEITSDAQTHLDKLRRDEHAVLKELKDKEARVRILLAELKALQQLKKEATNKLQSETQELYKEEIARHKKERVAQEEELESIDELVSDVQEARSQSAPENSVYQSAETQPLYNLQNPNQIAEATDGRIMGDLYALRDKEVLTSDDVQKAFQIANDVILSNSYESMSSFVQERKETVYQTLKNVLEQRPDIVNQYRSDNDNSPMSQFIDSLKKSSVTDYKK